MDIATFPLEILEYIFSFLDAKSLLRLTSVNKEWRQMCENAKVNMDLKFINCIKLGDKDLISIFDRFHNIKLLSISTSYSLSKEGFRFVKGCETLELCWCHIPDDGSFDTLVQNCPSLSTLKLIGFGDTSPSNALTICQCDNLTKLTLENFKYINLVKWKYFSKLNYISLNHCYNITDKEVESIAKNCRNLRHLNLRNCMGITDAGICYIGTYCENLEEFLIAHNYSITSEGIIAIADGCKKLKTLCLDTNYNVRDNGIQDIIGKCRGIKVLRLSGCSKLTDESLYKISTDNNIEELDISFTKVSNFGIKHVIKNCDKLKVLKISGCHSIGLEEIGKSKKLENLIVSFHNNLTAKDIEHLLSMKTLEFICMFGCNKTGVEGIEIALKIPSVKKVIAGSSGVTRKDVEILSKKYSKIVQLIV